MARATKMPRQEVKVRMTLPICGAMRGPSPVASVNAEKNFTRATPECRSRAIERDIPMPAAPPSPWTILNTTRK